MIQNLKGRIDALPEPERSIRRAFFTEDEWETSWALQAFPFQIPPPGDEWRVWSTYAPPRTGTTTAGIQWVASLMERDPENVRAVVLLRSLQDLQPTARALSDELYRMGMTYIIGHYYNTEIDINVTQGSKISVFTDTSNHQGRTVTHLWGDEITDAARVVQDFPTVNQFVFTNPLRPAPGTLVSRYGVDGYYQ